MAMRWFQWLIVVWCTAIPRNVQAESSALRGSPQRRNQQQQQQGGHTKPVKVFLLAGQSNMVGQGDLEELRELCSDSSQEYREALWNTTSDQFQVHPHVYAFFRQGHNVHRGNLCAHGGFADYGRFGIEVMLGWILGEHFGPDQPVYLVKTAWGGQALAVQFRPPSAGPAHFPGFDDLSIYGHAYDKMTRHLQQALREIPQVIPNYNPQVGYEMAGVVWVHGFNDLLVEDFRREYKKNLALWIRDVRRELFLPKLPVAIAELGMHGVHPQGPKAPQVVEFRHMQRDVTSLPDMNQTTVFVPTSPYVPTSGDLLPQQEGHYFMSAPAFFHMGQALGRALVDLLQQQVPTELAH